MIFRNQTVAHRRSAGQDTFSFLSNHRGLWGLCNPSNPICWKVSVSVDIARCAPLACLVEEAKWIKKATLGYCEYIGRSSFSCKAFSCFSIRQGWDAKQRVFHIKVVEIQKPEQRWSLLLPQKSLWLRLQCNEWLKTSCFLESSGLQDSWYGHVWAEFRPEKIMWREKGFGERNDEVCHQRKALSRKARNTLRAIAGGIPGIFSTLCGNVHLPPGFSLVEARRSCRSLIRVQKGSVAPRVSKGLVKLVCCKAYLTWRPALINVVKRLDHTDWLIWIQNMIWICCSSTRIAFDLSFFECRLHRPKFAASGINPTFETQVVWKCGRSSFLAHVAYRWGHRKRESCEATCLHSGLGTWVFGPDYLTISKLVRLQGLGPGFFSQFAWAFCVAQISGLLARETKTFSQLWSLLSGGSPSCHRDIAASNRATSMRQMMV